MSDASSISRSENSVDYCEFGVERLLKLLDAFEQPIDGVIKNGDVECVHKMRVASRRVRAAMPLFKDCFPKKQFKKWLKKVKQITKILGEARDLDVQINLIQKFQSENSDKNSQVISLVLKSFAARRAKVQPTVINALQNLLSSGVLMEMREFYDDALEEVRKLEFNPTSVLEKAYWNISYRIDGVLALEEYVHEENQILKHHKMRIQAKWLRYTMETYSDLYKNKLTEEIETVKSFQDVLGEIHDYYILAQYISKFKTKKRSKTASRSRRLKGNQKPIQEFLRRIEEQRRAKYASFVKSWDDCKDSGFFDKLRDTISSGLPSPMDKIIEMQKNSEAPVAVLADIHGNLDALQAVIEDAEKRGITSFLNAGDLIGFGPFPDEVVKTLRSKNIISVVGNFDLEALENGSKEKGEKKIALEFAKNQVSGACKSYLLSLPRCIQFEVRGRSFLMTHGTPDSIDEHLYRDASATRLKEIREETKADVIITGHSHEQYVREVSGSLFINPGSVGRPYDGNPQAAYAVMKLDPPSVDLIRMDYNVAAAADALRDKGLPESFSQMLLNGVTIEELSNEDRKRKDLMARSCKEVIKKCEKVSDLIWPDTEHYVQVKKLALRLFDQMKLNKLHELGKTERCWLECASVLHDIGISQGAKGHHKKSMELVLNDSRLLFSSGDRRIIASIIRYHRKSIPKKGHSNLNTLGPKVVRKIRLLSGILRVADSLDYAHNEIVKNLSTKLSPEKITVQCTSLSDPQLEEQAFNKKKGLLENVLGRKMVITWKNPLS